MGNGVISFHARRNNNIAILTVKSTVGVVVIGLRRGTDRVHLVVHLEGVQHPAIESGNLFCTSFRSSNVQLEQNFG